MTRSFALNRSRSAVRSSSWASLAVLPLLFWLALPALAQQAFPPDSPVVCAYNLTPPTVTTGQMVYAQCDANGNLKTAGGGGGGGGAITSPLGPTTAPAAAVSTITADTPTYTLSSTITGPLTSATFPTGAIPTAGYQSIAIQMTAIGGVATSPQESNDGVTWANGGMCVQSTATGSAAPMNNFNTLNGLFICPLRSAFFRINLGGAPSGTPTAVVTLKAAPLAPSSVFSTPTTSTPTTGSGSTSAVTVAASAATCLAARTAPKTVLAFKNESLTASIAVSLGGTAALNTAGSFTIPPGGLYSFSGSYIPLDIASCIASAAATPLTVISQ